MKSIANILGNRANGSQLIKQVTAALTVETANDILEKIFGTDIKEMAQAVYIKQKILTIACIGSTVAQEIKLHEEILLKEIVNKVGPGIVVRICFIT